MVVADEVENAQRDASSSLQSRFCTGQFSRTRVRQGFATFAEKSRGTQISILQPPTRVAAVSSRIAEPAFADHFHSPRGSYQGIAAAMPEEPQQRGRLPVPPGGTRSRSRSRCTLGHAF